MLGQIVTLSIRMPVFFPGLAAKVFSKGLGSAQRLECGIQIAGISDIGQTVS